MSAVSAGKRIFRRCRSVYSGRGVRCPAGDNGPRRTLGGYKITPHSFAIQAALSKYPASNYRCESIAHGISHECRSTVRLPGGLRSVTGLADVRRASGGRLQRSRCPGGGSDGRPASFRATLGRFLHHYRSCPRQRSAAAQGDRKGSYVKGTGPLGLSSTRNGDRAHRCVFL